MSEDLKLVDAADAWGTTGKVVPDHTQQFKAFGVYAPDGYLLQVVQSNEEALNVLHYHGYKPSDDYGNFHGVVETEFWGRVAADGLITVYRSREFAENRSGSVVGYWRVCN